MQPSSLNKTGNFTSKGSLFVFTYHLVFSPTASHFGLKFIAGAIDTLVKNINTPHKRGRAWRVLCPSR